MSCVRSPISSLLADIDLRVNCNDSFSEIGPYCEVAFFHSKTKTLLVTDCVVQVPRQPLEIVDPEVRSAARDAMSMD